MIKQLDKLRIAYEFVDAIDGQELSNREMEMYDVGVFKSWSFFNARNLAKCEIGCLLSHLKMYRRMVDENIECACILEDDCILDKDLESLMKNQKFLESDYELLLLGHSGLYQNPFRGAEYSYRKKHVFSQYYIAEPVECPSGTYAYLIKQSAARKLLQHCYPIRMPMDNLTGNAQAIGVNVRILTPPIVMHNKALFTSTIYGGARDNSLFLCKIRKLKAIIGEKYPLLRKLNRICRLPYTLLCLKLRKAGLIDENSFLEKRHFQQK